MDCANCGAPVEEGSGVCASCGSPVGGDETLVMGAAAAGAAAGPASSAGAAGQTASAAGSAVAAATPPAATVPPQASKPFWKKAWFWVVAAVVVVLIVVVVWLLLRGVAVPDVVGMSEEDAQAAAEEAGLVFVVSGTEYSTELEPGTVISQSPEAGEKAKKDDQLSVVLATDTEMVLVPDVVGQLALPAVNTLQAAGFTIGEIVGEASDEPQGTVLAQDPVGGTEANIGTGILLTLSEGPADASVAVPNLVGMQQSVAEEMLAVLGLAADSSTVSSAAPVGEIVAQTPAAGTTVPAGETIVIVASDGTGATTTTAPATSTTAPATSTTKPGTTSTTIANQVTILGLLDMAFDPEEITVSAGDTVTWFNDDIEVHIIVADDDSFESEPLDPGDLFPWTFGAAGTFTYHCGLHADEAGTVIVQ